MPLVERATEKKTIYKGKDVLTHGLLGQIFIYSDGEDEDTIMIIKVGKVKHVLSLSNGTIYRPNNEDDEFTLLNPGQQVTLVVE